MAHRLQQALFNMKLILIMIVFVSYCSIVFAENMPFIESGRYNLEKKAIEINIHYGGCNNHKFKLQIDLCLMSFPIQCNANLIDLTPNDYCEMLIRKTELDIPHYEDASIKIHDERNTTAFITLVRPTI